MILLNKSYYQKRMSMQPEMFTELPLLEDVYHLGPLSSRIQYYKQNIPMDFNVYAIILLP